MFCLEYMCDAVMFGRGKLIEIWYKSFFLAFTLIQAPNSLAESFCSEYSDKMEVLLGRGKGNLSRAITLFWVRLSVLPLKFTSLGITSSLSNEGYNESFWPDSFGMPAGAFFGLFLLQLLNLPAISSLDYCKMFDVSLLLIAVQKFQLI